MQDVLTLVRTTTILRDDSYIVSYPYLLEYFNSKRVIGPGDVVCGAHMVYGWMPTIVELYPTSGKFSLAMAADVLEKARISGKLTESHLQQLASLVNNSLVGASKLLHFVAPAHFAIWDSKIYSFVHEKRPHNYRVNRVKCYLDYLQLLTTLQSRQDFPQFHKSVEAKVGYTVTPMRALELVMFLNAPVYAG